MQPTVAVDTTACVSGASDHRGSSRWAFPLTGTSVNPARSLGPALVVGGTALSQLWVFILAPRLSGALAALAYRYLVQSPAPDDLPTVTTTQVAADRELGRTRATP